MIARDIPSLLQRHQDGELHGLISRCFRLDQIDEALDEVRSGTALRNMIVFDRSAGAPRPDPPPRPAT